MPSDRPLDAIRTVAFDAVGTLIFPDPPVAEVYHRVARRWGSALSADAIAANFRAAFRRDECAALESAGRADWMTPDGLRSSEPRERDRWRRIVAEAIPDAREPGRCFEELFAHFARPDAWACFDDVGPTLAELRRQGYRLLIASNFDARLEPVWRGRPELAPVAGCVISSLVGFRKPSPVFFHYLVEAAGCPADCVLMVGDDEECDVRGAQRAGLRGIQICRTSETGEGIRRLDELLTWLPRVAPHGS